ncbi:MAG: hypothetical protein O7C59_11465 [Rickettsia endosymbiont of Ixodes persulcatus]|nr:hypothetical protein [Rickettsia endosymbiont of Ixodes persulcatus]MCZ6914977.1 hypothetical protein [Rickettsia endosymbiont of Ixodes persulcatus]
MFDKLSFAEGDFFAELNQTVVMSQLKGTENGITVNLDNAADFSLSLRSNVEFQYKT